MAKQTVKALNIEYAQNTDGSYDFDNVIDCSPVKWEDWIKLPVRSCDAFVQTGKNKIRIPTVVCCSEYGKVPMKRAKLSPKTIYDRDNGVCQYSGRKLSRSEASLDHILPRAKGGKTTWENIALCDKQINNKKGDRLNHEVGLKLLRQPKAPPLLPASVSINAEAVAHRDWKLFLLK